jgi:hypothetical protein
MCVKTVGKRGPSQASWPVGFTESREAVGMEKGQTPSEIAGVKSVIKMDLHDCIQSKSGMTGEMEKELVKKLLSFLLLLLLCTNGI